MWQSDACKAWLTVRPRHARQLPRRPACTVGAAEPREDSWHLQAQTLSASLPAAGWPCLDVEFMEMLEALGLTSRVFQLRVTEPKKVWLKESSREAQALRPHHAGSS